MASDVSIDELEIEISAASEQAANHVKALSDSLKELRKSLPTTTNTKRIKEFADSANSIDDSAYNKLNRLAKAIERLGALSKVKIPADLGDNLRNITLSVQFISDDAIERLDKLTSSLQKLSNVDLRGAANAMRGKIDTQRIEPQNSGQEQESGGDVAREGAEAKKTLADIRQSIMQANSLWKTFASAGTSALNTVSAKSKDSASTISDSLKNAFGRFTQTGFIKDFSDAFRGIGKEAAEHLHPIANAAKYIGATIAQPIIAGFQKIAPAILPAAKSVGNAIKSIVSHSISAGSALGGALFNGAKKAASGVLQLSKNIALMPFNTIKNRVSGAVSAINKFTSSIGRIALYRTIRRIIQMISQAVKEGVDNLSAYSSVVGTDFHRSMDSIATDALYIKNSFATVVAPLINAVKPAIDAIADSIANALNLLAQFMAMLTGASTYTRAIKKTTEYGDAVQKAGAKAKEAAKSLLKIDELNLLNDNKSGGGGANADDFASMFEEAEVNSTWGDLGKTMREAIEQGDWDGAGRALAKKLNGLIDGWNATELGRKIGKKLNNALSLAYGFMSGFNFESLGSKIAGLINGQLESINFDTVGRLWMRFKTALLDTFIGFIMGLDASLIGKSIGDFLNGAISEAQEWLTSKPWEEIGNKIGELINSTVSNVKSVLDSKEFGTLGKSIAELINGALETINFSDIGATVSKVFTNIIDEIAAFISTLDWGLVAKSASDLLTGALNGLSQWLQGKDWSEAGHGFYDKLKSALENIDFEEIGKSIFKLLGAALGATVSFIGSFVSDVIQDIKDYFLQYIEDENGDGKFGGKEIIRGVLDGIAWGLDGIVQWIRTNVFEPFINAFKSVFQIHSPSKVMEEQGGFIIQGLLNGISEKWKDITSFFERKWNDLKTWWSGLTLPAFKIKLPHFNVSGSFNLDPKNFSIPSISVSWYAKGGFPEDGLFFANHNELVGQFSNGRTAVANNEQITQGIAEAVYRAFTEAFAATGGNSNSNNDRPVNIYLDGKQIATTTTRYQQQYARAMGV